MKPKTFKNWVLKSPRFTIDEGLRTFWTAIDVGLGIFIGVLIGALLQGRCR